MKKALITGISGQDGSYLSELLVGKGYEVHGIIRRHSVAESQASRIEHLDVTTHYGDLLDPGSIEKVFCDVMPDECYNLAAMSHVRISFDVPEFTTKTNGLAVFHLLEMVRNYRPLCKFYQASSSEMFGNSIDKDGYQRESTPMHPVSPYGIAKLHAYNLVRHYRKAYGLFCANGILFNHESPRRGSNFVTQKIIKTAVQIKHGLADELTLGNTTSQRDWGHSKDYVRAMHAILNHNKSGDFVIATGETHSIENLYLYVFGKLDIPTRYIKYDPKYTRPEELDILCGDASKARDALGWKPECSFFEMVDEMIWHWENDMKHRGCWHGEN